MKIRYATMDTPVGPVAVAWSGDTILALQMAETRDRKGWSRRDKTIPPETRLLAGLEARFGPVEIERTEPTRGPARNVSRYFAGGVHAIDAVAVDPGGTPYQARIWEKLREIPAGETVTYGELASAVGSGPRAAGGAVGRNPIPIVIPCHRVIAADGTLNGFGGGLRRKRWLLRHEGAAFRDDARQPELFRVE